MNAAANEVQDRFSNKRQIVEVPRMIEFVSKRRNCVSFLNFLQLQRNVLFSKWSCFSCLASKKTHICLCRLQSQITYEFLTLSLSLSFSYSIYSSVFLLMFNLRNTTSVKSQKKYVFGSVSQGNKYGWEHRWEVNLVMSVWWLRYHFWSWSPVDLRLTARKSSADSLAAAGAGKDFDVHGRKRNGGRRGREKASVFLPSCFLKTALLPEIFTGTGVGWKKRRK